MRWSGPSRRRRLLGVGLLLALVAGGLTFLLVGRSRFAWDRACTLARRQLPGLLGAEVGLGRCEVDPAGRTLRIHGLSAAAPDTERPTFSADEVEVTVAGVQPLSGRLELARVRVIRPRIVLVLSRPQPPTATATGCPLRTLEHVLVDTLEVRGAEFRISLPAGRKVEVAGVELSWRTRRRDAEFTLRTSQGLVDLANGRPPLAVAGLAVEGARARRPRARGEPGRAVHRRCAAVLRRAGGRPLPPGAGAGRAALPAPCGCWPWWCRSARPPGTCGHRPRCRGGCPTCASPASCSARAWRSAAPSG
jgi:hypothetical protein